MIHQEARWQRADQAITDHEDWEYEAWSELAADPLPRKRLPFPGWHLRAACASLPLEEAEATFFGARDTEERPALSMSDVLRAKDICSSCPVYDTCLTNALGAGDDQRREEYGIWAGTSGRTRKRIWRLVDSFGHDLNEIIDDILQGNLALYERDGAIGSTPQVLPLPRVSSEDVA